MKKLLYISIVLLTMSCDNSYPTHEYNQYTFDINSEYKFPVIDTDNNIDITLQEFTSIQLAKFQFKFMLDNTEGVVIKDNEGNVLINNQFYPIIPGTKSLKYTNSKAELNGITVIVQNLTYPGGSNQSKPEQIKRIYLDNTASGFNFSAYNYNWDVQGNANIAVNVRPKAPNTLQDYSLSLIIIKKDPNDKFEPYFYINNHYNTKYYNGDRLPIKAEESIIHVTKEIPKNAVDYIQFQLESKDGQNFLSDKLSITESNLRRI